MKTRLYISTGITTALFGLSALALSGNAIAANNSMSQGNGSSMAHSNKGMSHNSGGTSGSNGGGMSHSSSGMSQNNGGMSSGGMSQNSGGSMSSGGMSHDSSMSGSMPKSQVKSVQTALKNHGANISVDGVMGPHTRSALRQYQNQNGLKATGRPDTKTLHSLGAGSSSGRGMSQGSSMGNHQ